MSKNTISMNEDGRLLIKPSNRLGIIWSFDPVSTWKPPHQMVGSVLAHQGHLDVYGAVYWSLSFTVSESVLGQFAYPLSGYLYSSGSGEVKYRVRVIDMSPGPRKKLLEYVPMWRKADTKRKNLYILLDQIEELNPHRDLKDFEFYENPRPLETPPSGNYFKIRDPLY